MKNNGNNSNLKNNYINRPGIKLFKSGRKSARRNKHQNNQT